jgi:hypothetical protein
LSVEIVTVLREKIVIELIVDQIVKEIVMFEIAKEMVEIVREMSEIDVKEKGLDQNQDRNHQSVADSLKIQINQLNENMKGESRDRL